MSPHSAPLLPALRLGGLVLALWVLLPRQDLLAQGYELDSVSAEPPPAVMSGDAYSMQADAAAGVDLSAAGDGYAFAAQTAVVVVIESVTVPTLTIAWNPASGIRVAWFDPTDRFTLQIKSDLGPNVTWSTVDAVTHEGATAVFAEDGAAVGGARFFRLQGN
jgi:hypothetical protein